MEWGISRSRGHKTKETYPTRPGSPTPCKQGLRSFWKLHVVVVQNNGGERYKTKCAARAKLLLLIRPIVVLHRFPALHAFAA